ncbi:MAG: phosphatase PAP2 family protein [Armatimonadetes bacterium]|nr:phosphatase PAP2 family protein [Armatimonadota bacterium]
MTRIFCYSCQAVLLLTISLASPSMAADFASAAVRSTKPVLAIGVAACLFSSEEEGVARATRASDAVAISVGIARLIKSSFDLSSGYDRSFPSGHTAGAFAMAESLSDVHPEKKWLYYTLAAAIGWSTVKTGGHSWTDVAGGAALGIAVGKWSIRSENGIILGHVRRF